MKAFSFRLDRVLRWRVTQVAIQQARTAAATARLAAVESALAARRAEVRASASQITQAPAGAALQSYARFILVAQRDMKDLEGQAVGLRKALGVEMNALKEASRKVQLLENLRDARQNNWQKEFDREIAAFADESFLYRSRI